MPGKKSTIEREEELDEYDRKLSESVRIKIIIENSMFKHNSKHSDEFSYGS
mgnify:CR=1 FL=1